MIITAMNGRIPLQLLTVIDSKGHLLTPPAAASIARARAAGFPTGPVTSAYRDRAEQQRMLDLYGYPHAEYPGRSFHGEGLAVDFPAAQERWMRTHPSYGWRFRIPSEPWHGEYHYELDTSNTTPPIPTLPAGTLPQKEETMRIVSHAGTVYIVNGMNIHALAPGNQTNVAIALWGAPIGLDDNGWIALTQIIQGLITDTANNLKGQGID